MKRKSKEKKKACIWNILALNRILWVNWGEKITFNLYKETEIERTCHLPKITKLNCRGDMTTGQSTMWSKKEQCQLWLNTVFPDLRTDPDTQEAIKKYLLNKQLQN